MGCGGSKDAGSPQQAPPQQQQQQQQGGGGGGAKFRNCPVIAQPNSNDPPFMQTAAPSGMSWSQYCRGAKSFIDQNGFLGGPWAECIAWGVVFEHANDWERMPQYAKDGVVGGILEALRTQVGGKRDIMDAADKLEEASHRLADNGQQLPAIQQAVTLPANAVPGQPCRVGHPQMPGAYQTVNVPQGARPGQTITTTAPVQPTQNGKTGMSTGSKVAFAAGGVVAVGAAAGVAYYATQGGGFDGFQGDMSALGGMAGDGAGAAADWAPGAADQAGDWAGGAAGDAGSWAEGAAGDVGDWAPGAADAVGDWGTGAGEDIGGFLGDLF